MGGTSMRGWLNNQFRGDLQRRSATSSTRCRCSRSTGCRCAGSGSWTPATRRSSTTEQPRAQLPARTRARRTTASRRSRTRSASARGSTCGRSCCHCSASILGMVSKPVTSRSISRSASLISALGRLRSQAGAWLIAPSRRSRRGRRGARQRRRPRSRLVLVGGDVWTMDPAHPHATAVASRGDQIVAVGDDAAIARARRAGDPGDRAARPRGDARPGRRALPPLRPRRRSRERLGARRCASEAAAVAGRSPTPRRRGRLASG